MSKPAFHVLTIEPLRNGRFRVFGQHLGKQISKVSKNPAVLEALRLKMYAHIEPSREGSVLWRTWLSEEQIRAAEAAVMLANTKGRSSTEPVTAGAVVIAPELKSKKWKNTVAEWIAYRESAAWAFGLEATRGCNVFSGHDELLPFCGEESFVNDVRVARFASNHGLSFIASSPSRRHHGKSPNPCYYDPNAVQPAVRMCRRRHLLRPYACCLGGRNENPPKPYQTKQVCLSRIRQDDVLHSGLTRPSGLWQTAINISIRTPMSVRAVSLCYSTPRQITAFRPHAIPPLPSTC